VLSHQHLNALRQSFWLFTGQSFIVDCPKATLLLSIVQPKRARKKCEPFWYQQNIQKMSNDLTVEIIIQLLNFSVLLIYIHKLMSLSGEGHKTIPGKEHNNKKEVIVVFLL
jgi:hypothetical protein